MIKIRMNLSLVLTFLFINLALMACTNPTNLVKENDTNLHADPIEQNQNIKTDDQGIREFGLLKNVEDSGYPFFVLTIEFPERKRIEEFNLNIENLKNLNPQLLTNAVGKYVSFEYESDLVNTLLDLKYRGKSLIDQGENFEEVSESKRFTGVLSKATLVTDGDLPGIITITATNGNAMNFEYFITPEMVNVNGNTVVANFEERTVNTISSLLVKK